MHYVILLKHVLFNTFQVLWTIIFYSNVFKALQGHHYKLKFRPNFGQNGIIKSTPAASSAPSTAAATTSKWPTSAELEHLSRGFWSRATEVRQRPLFQHRTDFSRYYFIRFFRTKIPPKIDPQNRLQMINFDP
jgi:hypothetical protein